MRKTSLKKGLISLVLAATMLMSVAAPAYAAEERIETFSDGTMYVKTDNIDKYANYPCWVWWQGYCYYYDKPYHWLTSCVTPDGYTVDEFGRWTENGVAVHNGFGSVKVGTDEYLGKSDDEIWNLMKGKLVNTFKSSIPLFDNPGFGDDGYTYGLSKNGNWIWHGFGNGIYGAQNAIYYKNTSDKTFLTVSLDGNWSDQANNTTGSYSMAAYANCPDTTEKVIKTTIGDNIGNELFQYIKEHADKKELMGWKGVLDENGNEIVGRRTNLVFNEDGGMVSYDFIEDPTGWETLAEYTLLGDGINVDTLDLSPWQNRVTDYGKHFDLVKNGHLLMIYVYN